MQNEAVGGNQLLRPTASFGRGAVKSGKLLVKLGIEDPNLGIQIQSLLAYHTQ